MPVRGSKTSTVVCALAVLLMVCVSPAPVLHANATFVVTRTADDEGQGSLRWAINQANNTPGFDTIDFQIPLDQFQPIHVLTQLPTIADPVLIDGSTQPGIGGRFIPIVEIDGDWAPDGTEGLIITSHGSTVQSLVITRFSGAGIHLTDSASTNQIFNCWIGMNYGDFQQFFPDYNNPVRNEVGVLIDGSASSNMIGGPDARATSFKRNVISGNRHAGVRITGNATVNSVVNNFIGTDFDGLFNVGNGNVAGDQVVAGVVILGGYAQDNYIGSPSGALQGDQSFGNVISGGIYGVLLDGAASNYVQDNWIGYSKMAGGAPVPNWDGIGILHGAVGNVIGGRSGEPWQTASTFGNIITQNHQAGILVLDDTTHGNSIRYNSIYDNAIDAGLNPDEFDTPTLGIELGPVFAPLQNDPHDIDAGPNRLQNSPVVGHVDNEDAFSSKTLGSIFSEPNTDYTIDVYMNDTCHPLLPGLSNARWWYGSAPVHTDANGVAGFEVDLGAALPLDLFITAIATSADGSSSEISKCHAVNQAGTGNMIVFPDPPPFGNGNGAGGFAVSLKNDGPNVARNVVLANTLPTGLTFATCRASHGGVCGGSGNQRQVSFRRLAPGEVATVAITATLNPVVVVPPGDTVGGVGQVVSAAGGAAGGGSAAGPLTFTTAVMVTSDTFDPNPFDNIVTMALTIGGPDTHPPVITHAAAHPDELWPPDGRLHEVRVSYDVSDNVDPRSALSCSLSIGGAGVTATDGEVLGAHHVRLRANPRGHGPRDYAIAISCADRAGNIGTQTIHVPVAREEEERHDRDR